MTKHTCPTCGSPVRVVSSDEGMSYYEPVWDGSMVVKTNIFGDKFLDYPDAKNRYEPVLTVEKVREIAAHAANKVSCGEETPCSVCYRFADEALRDHGLEPEQEGRHEAIRKDLDALYGKGPGGKLNFAYADGYFKNHMEKKYGKSLKELKEEIDYVEPEQGE